MKSLVSLCIVLILIFCSCKKESYDWNQFAGIYTGTTETWSQTSQIAGGDTTSGSYTDTLNVTVNMETFSLGDGWIFHADSLDESYVHHEGYGGNYREIRFSGDSVVFTTAFASPGGQGWSTFYGKKIM